jgi:hypothetical protein
MDGIELEWECAWRRMMLHFPGQSEDLTYWEILAARAGVTEPLPEWTSAMWDMYLLIREQARARMRTKGIGYYAHATTDQACAMASITDGLRKNHLALVCTLWPSARAARDRHAIRREKRRASTSSIRR